VAGLFYPDDPLLLQQQVEALLAAATPPPDVHPRALVVPHAGYIYSGPVAARAYALLPPLRGRIRRVVLLGPAHRLPFTGIAASSARYFATPLGSLRVDQEALDRVITQPAVRVLDEAHRDEHSLEVQLPFLQTVLDPGIGLLPLLAGDVDPKQVAALIENLWDDSGHTLFVISSDLSHYHDYQSARRLDEATAMAIAQLNPEAIDPAQACGRTPLNGLLYAARRHHLSPLQLDLRNSGDTAGGRDRVVGYGAWAFA
ncbi:MAG TPA: AmmeMemoRadiSam system protein B, partial [Thiotrichales bacterium]|nr:AmmeMemoRadiSam system protein B [Thiotrichales bacterium]